MQDYRDERSPVPWRFRGDTFCSISCRKLCSISPRDHFIFPSLSPVIFATPIRNSVFISWKIMKSFSTLMEILIGCRHKKVKHIFSCWHHLLWNKKQISPLSQKDRWVRGLLGQLQIPKHLMRWFCSWDDRLKIWRFSSWMQNVSLLSRSFQDLKIFFLDAKCLTNYSESPENLPFASVVVCEVRDCFGTSSCIILIIVQWTMFMYHRFYIVILFGHLKLRNSYDYYHR